MEDISRRQFMGTLGLTGAVLALGLAGCGSSSSSSSSGSGSSSSSDSKIQTIKDRGQLNAGVKKDVVGFGLLDTATGKYQGMEIDLCYQVAAKIFDVSYDDAKSKDLVAFTDVTPKTRGPLIDNDTLDIICATYTITDERKESWDFTDPYFTDYIGVLIKKSSGMSTMADLDGKIIGVSQGSTTKDAVTQMLSDNNISATPQFKEYADYASISSALDAGNIDAFAVDRSILKGYTTDDRELLDPDIKFGAQEYGIATKKGSDLSDLTNEVVDDVVSSGWIDQETETWGLL
ncbi:MAG: substrate-binding domain-containing protein [Atopobiaceae bacterium]|jgi:putative glutamine transport system substrate-binding protein|nr:substrate-binding domain-containing protein [Olegusella sp.]NLH92084.1 transporter substrate-binding domain-containing protein [Atopobium sp.]